MLRVGIDVRLTYYRRGGIAEYMRQLVMALAQLDAPYRFKILHNFRMTNTVGPFKRVNCLTPCHHRHELRLLGMELLPRRLDLLHSPDFIPPRMGAKRYVITVHDLAFLLYKDIQTVDSLRYYAGQIRRAVQQVDHIIAVSQATKDDLIRLLDVPPDKVTVTWEGVHPQYQVLAADAIAPVREKYRLPPEYLLFVGTIEPRKNLPALFTAYDMLKKRGQSPPKLVLVGQKGWLSDDELEPVVDLRLLDDVMWLDDVQHDELPMLYNGARLHILPSLYEGFGFPPLEAMACGTPTIVSARGALREVAGEAAAFIRPDDPDFIAAAIQELLTDAARYQELRQRGLQHVKQFTWESTAQQTVAVYQKVLDT